jgi:hypothetical protein
LKEKVKIEDAQKKGSRWPLLVVAAGGKLNQFHGAGSRIFL